MNRYTMGKNLICLRNLGIVLVVVAVCTLAWSGCGDGSATGESIVDATKVVPTTEVKETASGEGRPSISERPEAPAAPVAPQRSDVTATAESLPTIAEPTRTATMGEVLPVAAEPTATLSPSSTEVAANVQGEKPEPTETEPAPTPTAASVTAATDSQTAQGGAFAVVSGDAHYGPSSLEERINMADVVAVVEFEYVRPTVAHFRKTEGTVYRPAIVYSFDVVEYLKGGGEDELTAIVYNSRYYDTEKEAMEIAEPIPYRAHDRRWERHQSIIFVEEDVVERNGLLTSHDYQFVIAGTGVPRLSNFHIGNEYNKVWLPAVGVDDSALDIGDGMKFLLDDPDKYVYEDEIPTITLGELRKVVESEKAAYDAGVSAHGKELYKACLAEKYLELRFFSQLSYYLHEVEGVPSGLPSGTQILNEANWGATPQVDLYSVDFVEGDDAALFSVEPVYFHTVRPIPQGEYRFYWWGYGEDPENPIRHACGFDDLPEEFRKLTEVSIKVVGPDDAIYEAFFDPVDVNDDTAGFSKDNGVLDPAAFTIDGVDTKINRIDWSSGKVQVQLTPHSTLAGRHIDFIVLDGSVSLRLDFDDAVEVAADDGTQSHSWGVCEQPWRDGDKLMIRISESETELTDVTNDAACPEAQATP